MVLNVQTITVHSRCVSEHPLGHPEQAIFVYEDKEGNVHVAGVDIPQAQLERLQELLIAWKYGIIEAQ